MQDVVKAIDGAKVGNGADVVAIVRKNKPGNKLKIDIRRGDETLKLEVVLGKVGGDAGVAPQKAAGSPYLGLGVAGDAEDCTIGKVAPGSPAEKAGLKEGDVIVQANGQKIAGGADLVQLVQALRPGDAVQLVVRRRDETVKMKVVLGAK